MDIIDNINHLLGDDIKRTIKKGSALKIAASCFSIYAFEALKDELQKIESLEFIFTSPTFVPDESSDKIKKEHRRFYIPKAERERNFYGSDFEIQLRNKLNQRAIAKECADWIKEKATFRSNSGKSPMQQFACIKNIDEQSVYLPLHGFTAVDLGYQQGDAVSNIVTKLNEPESTQAYLSLFNQIWNDPEKIEDVTSRLCEHIASVYKENSPEQIYFLMLYNIFNEFLEDINEDVLPNDLTGYKDSLIWNKLYNFQQDGATGIINKLETYNGCILADSVGLGKTFTALAVVKYYELRNKSVLVLCPKKLANNWLNYNRNLKTNIFSKDRFNYDVLCHTDLQRTSGESFGTPLDRINWGNYDLVVIDESHNFRNNDAFKDKETRYQKLMNSVIKEGVKTKVLMLSATPVNNRFNDLKNQLSLAYEGDTSNINSRLKTTKGIDEIFRKVQATFNTWAKLPPEERTTEEILKSLDFDFFELLDSVTIARSRKHIQTFYDTAEIGTFPKREKPISYHSPLTSRDDVMGFNDIFAQLKPSRKVQDAFAAQIKKIVWQYKLAPKTTNLSETAKVKEIEIFEIPLKTEKLDTNLLRYIDKAIAHPIIYQLKFGNKIKIAAAYKRPNDADASKWVIGDTYFCTDWQAEDKKQQKLPVVLDLGSLYEHLLREIMPLPAKAGESMEEHIKRVEHVLSKEKEQKILELRLARIKQFNRKVELNSQLKMLDKDIKQLRKNND